MSAAVVIRGYVVGFGDCILLRLPDGAKTRHVLVDFGRAPNDAASLARFPDIARDVERQCNGHLDLLVCTHEHLDHLEGFQREREVFDRMQVDRVWMGLPSAPGYYDRYPKARAMKSLRAAVARFAADARRNGLVLHPGFVALLQNNLSNRERLDYLRQLGAKPVRYLARGKAVGAGRAFANIAISVLAPEPDVSVYYTASARANALVAGLMASGRGHAQTPGDAWTFPEAPRAVSGDLPGFSRNDFMRLRRAIREDGVAAARFIDRAQNNTSLCLLFEVGGLRLLLPGDAELESWDVMRRKCASALGKPVDFLKVSHHGSHNGTPLEMLDTLLPVKRRASAKALVSTKRNVYGTRNPVPDDSLLRDLARRCRDVVSTDGQVGRYVEVAF